MTFDANQMRVETFDKGKADDYSIITKDRLIIVDLRGRTFTVIDPAAMQARMAATRQQMEAAGTPDADPPLDVRDTGRRDTVDGRSCRIVEVESDSRVQEHCVVATSAIPGGAEMMASMLEVAKAMDTIFADLGPMLNMMDRVVGEYEAVKGIPVRTREMKNGKVESEIFLKGIQRVAVPADTFAPPAGFKEKPMDPL